MDKVAKKVRTESSTDSGVLEECKKEVRIISQMITCKKSTNYPRYNVTYAIE
jgi:hypothetical protein